MSLDGFLPYDRNALVAFDPRVADRFYRWTNRFARTLDVEVRGLERLPAGRALLVANHAFGWDIVFAMGAIWARTGRPVFVLAEHLWWSLPFVRRLASRVGAVDGTPDNVDHLLERDQLVLVLPGGMREALKPRELRYHLLWGKRYGFVRAAIRSQAPIVPMASIGSDELFDFVGDAYRRGEHWLGRPGIPIPLPARVLPIPHLRRLTYVVGEPIPPRAPREDAENTDVLTRVRHEVAGALHELIETELAARSGVLVDGMGSSSGPTPSRRG